ncbi:MAG: class I SAM-dependent methyltransferase, partial [Deltaproteobacteria bacterium]
MVAVEPAAAMRAEAQVRHPEAAISRVDDTLPALSQVHRQGHAFHVILLSGVWQHVLPHAA